MDQGPQQHEDCTVLTIAHRLNTIIDSHIVVVMDKGRVIEQGRPHVLLSKESGMFKKMVEATGRVSSTQLHKLAAERSQQLGDIA